MFCCEFCTETFTLVFIDFIFVFRAYCKDQITDQVHAMKYHLLEGAIAYVIVPTHITRSRGYDVG